jgi:hypothetical protein
MADPRDILLKIVQGDVSNVNIPAKTVITGKKIRNKVLKKIVNHYRESNIKTDGELLDMVIAFDEAVEKELIDDELLEKIRKDPKFLEN